MKSAGYDMKDNWLWDRKMRDAAAKKILKAPDSAKFVDLAALLLARKNEPREVLKDYLDPLVFCRYWPRIKRKMRQDRWGEPRIIFWQAIYEKLADRYRERGVIFKKEDSIKEPLLAETGTKIKEVRHRLGHSQKALAKKMGVSQQLISRIEKGGENVSLVTLTNIARAMGKRVEIVFED